MAIIKTTLPLRSSSGKTLSLYTTLLLTQVGLPGYALAASQEAVPADNGVVAGRNTTREVSNRRIATVSDRAYALLADSTRPPADPDAPDNGDPTQIFANADTLVTQGDWAFGALAQKGGMITLNGGSVETSGERAYGLLAGSTGSITSSADILTHGDNGIGVQAGDNPGAHDADVTLLSGSEITTEGNDAYGLHTVYSGQIVGSADITTSGTNSFGAFAESDSTIDLNNSHITTQGTQAAGILANNDAQSVGGQVNLAHSTITTSGDYAPAVEADAGSAIILKDVAIRTNGLYGFGVAATSNSNVNFQGGSILTANDKGQGVQDGDGSRAYALYAQDAGTLLNANQLQIHTLGQRAYGAYAISGATLDLQNSTVQTEGFMGYGLYASGEGTVLNANNVNVVTTGDVGDAIWAYDKATVNLDSATLHVYGGANANQSATGGESANGMTAVGSGTINANHVSIITEGDNSVGALAGGNVGGDDTAGNILLTNSRIQVNGENAVAAQVNTGSTLTVQNSVLNAAKGAGIALNDDAIVNLSNSSVAASQQTFLSTLTTDEASQTITLGAGTVATQNNGTLLQVNRQDGAGGTVALTLGAGSVTHGDIIDTDKHNAGGTDVTLAQGASWSGLMRGVRNFISQQSSQVTFTDQADIEGDLSGSGSTYRFSDAGGTIGGNVLLEHGSSTHGGTIATPIMVKGNVSIDPTSSFGGNWNIEGDVTNSGTLTPGNSIGRVNVGGSLNLASGSVYVAEVDDQGNADRINVTGNAQLNGTVEATPYSGMKLNTAYTILTATGGLNNSRFDNVTMNGDYAFISPVLAYDNNAVRLTIDRNSVAYADVAQTDNQRRVASVLDALPVTSTLGNTLALSSVNTARTAFNQLAGEIHASLKNALLADTLPLRDAVTDHLSQLPATQNGGVWMQGYGASAGTADAGGIAGLHHSGGGVLLGTDINLANKGYIGLLTGYGSTHFDTGSRNESGSSRNYHLGLYGGSHWGNLALQAGIINSWNDITTDRYLGFDGLSEHLTGDYDARTLQTFAEVGYRLQADAIALEPFANLTHATLHTDAFSENGGVGALSADKQNMDTTWSTLGLKAGGNVMLGKVALQLSAKAGWQHAWQDTTPWSTLSLDNSEAFKVEGTHLAKDTAVLEAGVGTDLSQAVSVGVAWAGQFSDDTHNNVINASLKVRF
ncbi:autotransporter domain-containing protein [Paramixta manurensis]|uniref:Autotransporter domain-containing protein n=1 Tax=Paramixta manurensis TaxID=2740817 RepID=A0A6M8UHK8_9GAMM|nr:autotransporter domain-containing protein [Erwiniaceae bacterium PD-1]